VISGIVPGVLLAVLLGLIHGALAHLIWGKHWLHLPLFLIGGIAGCLIVWSTGLHLLTNLPAPGGLALVEATAVAWLLLVCVAAIRRA
jgi:hypothetical protein